METLIQINYRNEGHWDVWNDKKRLCRIRGDAGNVSVLQDHGDIENKEGFSNVFEAMKYVCEYYMAEDNKEFSEKFGDNVD